MGWPGWSTKSTDPGQKSKEVDDWTLNMEVNYSSGAWTQDAAWQ